MIQPVVKNACRWIFTYRGVIDCIVALVIRFEAILHEPCLRTAVQVIDIPLAEHAVRQHPIIELEFIGHAILLRQIRRILQALDIRRLEEVVRLDRHRIEADILPHERFISEEVRNPEEPQVLAANLHVMQGAAHRTDQIRSGLACADLLFEPVHTYKLEVSVTFCFPSRFDLLQPPLNCFFTVRKGFLFANGIIEVQRFSTLFNSSEISDRFTWIRNHEDNLFLHTRLVQRIGYFLSRCV
ncbi:hypothetical protein D3C71_1328850 [compost metagenome]